MSRGQGGGGGGGGGGRGRVDGQAGRGAVVQRVLGEGAQVPGGRAVVRRDAFAALQPGQGAVQQGGAAHLATWRGGWGGGGERKRINNRDALQLPGAEASKQ